MRPMARLTLVILLLAGLIDLLPAMPACAQSVEDLRQLSLEQLATIEISSVTKTIQPLSDAPAAIYVISHDEIIRSGAKSVPDILRLAPNLDVVETSASHYIITARGLSGNLSDQNFSNKLLVLIDGRTVYTPLFSGVYWDMQDVIPEDIDRIEVISGPGATLWGANAVNGVINIITKRTDATKGLLLDAYGGTLQAGASAQFGGAISNDINYRFYVKDSKEFSTEMPNGDDAHDSWSKPQGGFRVDWTPNAHDRLTLQGDAFGGTDDQPGTTEDINGRNILGRWTRSFDDGSSVRVRAYYDYEARANKTGGGDFDIDTYDVDAQHDFTLGHVHQITWGGGIRITDYDIRASGGLSFNPPSRTSSLSNLFAQDSISLARDLKLILGLKLEDDPYSSVAVLPSGRLTWKPEDNVLFWTAVSRAVRAPTPFDRDVVERVGGLVFLVGDIGFKPETLTAYELGTRVQAGSRVSFSISGFYNEYEDLRDIQYTPVTLIPLSWGNGFKGETWGFEAWGEFVATPWWRLRASISELKEHFDHTAVHGLLGAEQLGDDPEQRASLHSSMNLPHNLTLDAGLSYRAALPNPHLGSLFEANARLAWQMTDKVTFSVSGDNLLHARHFEFPEAEASAIPRSFLVDLEYHF